jgi:predicted transcriptional regulator
MNEIEFPEIKDIDSFVEVSEEVDEALKKSRGVRKVTDETTLSVAAEVLAEVDWVMKRSENERLEAGRPYRDHSDAVSAEFNELTSPLSGVKERLQEEIDAYQEKKQADIEKERQKHEKLAERRQERENKKAERQGRDPIIHTPPETPDADTTIKLAGGGQIQGKKVRKYRVIDFAKLPDEFKQENKGALNKAAKSGREDVPGLEFYYDKSNAITH